MTDRGVLVIVSSPSGAGKTTLTRRLIKEHSRLQFSVSHTTRSPRANETPGQDYHFISDADFQRMVEAHEFAEYAFVHGNRYGTAMAPVEEALARGSDMIFDVDWQGGYALAQRWPADSLKIFILPPDLATLERRLRGRATDAPEVIERRLQKAIEELDHFHEYQRLIVNDDVDQAYRLLEAMYLTRRYGNVDRADVAYPLAEMSRLVANNTEAEAHARRLVAR
ncbi:MAG TPA: guanylate kinase [Kofleriaceae bacterium]